MPPSSWCWTASPSRPAEGDIAPEPPMWAWNRLHGANGCAEGGANPIPASCHSTHRLALGLAAVHASIHRDLRTVHGGAQEGAAAQPALWVVEYRIDPFSQLVCPHRKFPSRQATGEDRGQDLIAGSDRLVEAARIELASEAASRKTSTSVLPVLHLTCPAPLGADPDTPVAVLSPPDGRDARRERVSGVYAGRRSC